MDISALVGPSERSGFCNRSLILHGRYHPGPDQRRTKRLMPLRVDATVITYLRGFHDGTEYPRRGRQSTGQEVGCAQTPEQDRRREARVGERVASSRRSSVFAGTAPATAGSGLSASG